MPINNVKNTTETEFSMLILECNYIIYLSVYRTVTSKS